MTGAELIVAKRREQLEEGRTVIKDVSENRDGELIMAALKMSGKVQGIPWPSHWNKERCKELDEVTGLDRLAIAGAFFAAEIDRQVKLDGAIYGKKTTSMEDFTEAARPLIKLLAEKHHPHVTAIVTCSNAHLLEGKLATGEIRDYLLD